MVFTMFFSVVDPDVDTEDLPSASVPNSQSLQLPHTNSHIETSGTDGLTSDNY